MWRIASVTLPPDQVWRLTLKVFPIICMALSIGAGPVSAVADVDLPPFYEAVTKLPVEGKLGQVIAQEPVATNIAGAEAWRIAFVSSDVGERLTVSTGLVVAPTGPVPAEGRPILAWAHGTTGTAQNCGPSQVLNPAQDLNEYFIIGGTSWTDFGVPALGDLIGKGYVVVAPDYQGLGGGGSHQYAIAATQGRDVINAIRAAGSLGLAGPSRKVGMFGWSQGGGAVLAAASLEDYIGQTGTAFDGIEFVGFGAYAPQDVAVLIPPGSLTEAGADKMMQGLATSFSDSVFNFTHFAMTIWAMPAAYPDLKLTDVFTADSVPNLEAIFSQKCMHAAADTVNFAFGDSYKTLVNPQPTNALAWVKALVAGSVAPAKPVAPMIIYWGTKDTTVDPVMGKLYREQMCGLGGDVMRVQLDGEQSHFTTPIVATPLFLPWIEDRFAGVAAPDGCAGG
jgi:hypothetical protein